MVLEVSRLLSGRRTGKQQRTENQKMKAEDGETSFHGRIIWGSFDVCAMGFAAGLTRAMSKFTAHPPQATPGLARKFPAKPQNKRFFSASGGGGPTARKLER